MGAKGDDDGALSLFNWLRNSETGPTGMRLPMRTISGV